MNKNLVGQYDGLEMEMLMVGKQIVLWGWRGDGNKSSSGDEIPERDVTYHLLCLLIYH